MKKQYITLLLVLFSICKIVAQTYIPTNDVLYVKKGSTGDGSSWTNAVGELADALEWASKNKAQYTSVNPLQIWVASGTYSPKHSPNDNDNYTETPTDPRDRAFLMVENVLLYGHFVGNETTLSARDFTNTAQATILNGDLGVPNDDTDNAYNVVIATTATTIDGFTITQGNANNSTPRTINARPINRANGGGISTNSNPTNITTIRNCIITNNKATTITTNTSLGHGAGIFVTNITTLNNTIISNNIASNQGGAIYNFNTNVLITLENSTISNNSARQGAGAYAHKITVSNSVISFNTAIESGGAIYGHDINLKNTLVSNNNATTFASAIFTNDKITLTNATIVNNIGPASLFYFTGSKTFNVINSVIFGNSIGFSNPITITKTYTNSLIQGETVTTNGNLDANNPDYTLATLFTDANHPTNPNYTLKSSSYLIDRGSNSSYIGNPNTAKDLAGNPRISHSIIDIGAYEYKYPRVLSITREAGAAEVINTLETSIRYTVTFSEPVSGVVKDDFELATTPTDSASGIISGVLGSGTTYTVTVTPTSDGTLRLDLKPNRTNIVNSNSLTVTDGFTTGESYTRDTVAPVKPTINLDATSDTGNSQIDLITNDSTPTFSGTAEALSTIRLYNGSTQLRDITTSDTGIWSYTTHALADGNNVLFAKSIDAAANSSISDGLTITIDTQSPTVSVTSFPTDGTYRTDAVLNFSVSFSEKVYAASTVNLKINFNGQEQLLPGTLNTDQTGYTFTYTIPSTINAPNGITLVELTGDIFDIAGNVANKTLNRNFPNIIIDSKISDLSITTTVDINTPNTNSNFTYTITITNNGPDEATNVSATAILPAGINYVSDTASQGNYNQVSGVWTVGTVTTNDPKTLTLTAVTTANSGSFTLKTTVESSILDTNTTNNSSSVTITVGKITQTISWNQNLDLGCGTTNSILLNAVSSSGLPITYESSNNSIAQIIGNELVFIGQGLVNITATQIGDGNHFAATPVTLIANNGLKNIIKQKWNDVLIFNNTSNNYKAWQWYKDGQVISGATGQYYNSPQPLNGTYHVVATDLNGNQLEVCPVSIMLNKKSGGITLNPNPVAPGSTFNLIANYTTTELQGAQVIITDLTGKLINQITNIQPTTVLQAPNTTAVYMVNLILSNGQNISAKLLVN